MKYLRFKKDEEIKSGLLAEQEIIEIEGNIAGDYKVLDERYSLDEVQLLAPCNPSKIVCVGLNYHDHATELEMAIPSEPIIFIKPATAVIGAGEEIKYPKMSKQVDYEAELGIVIKDRIKDISVAEAQNHILGYTCFNDVTARDLQKKDGQWTRAKSFDTFAPLGPVIETNVDPSDLKIQLLKNGELKQDSRTSGMIFSVPEVVSFVSKIMTLNPGDVIATGTPKGVGEVEIGDKVEVKIEGIGSLVNTIDS